MNKFQFQPENGDQAISVVGTDEIVLYIDGVHPVVIAHIVEMYNEGYSNKKIKDYLESRIDADTERVTPDEIEMIMESIEAFQESEKENAGKGDSKEAPFPHNLDEKSDKEVVGQVRSDDEALNMINNNLKGVPTVEEKKEKKTRTPRTASATPGKKVSIEDQIAAMKEKISLLEILNGVEEIEWPSDMSKGGREVMLSFSKEYDALIQKYIEIIQDL